MKRAALIMVTAGLLLLAGLFMVTITNGSAAATTTTSQIHHERQLRAVGSSTKTYNLTFAAQKWCQPPVLGPLNYHTCNPDDTVLEIPFMAGLTNGLKMMLLMVIKAFEENKCFYVTEKNNHLLLRDDKTQELSTFIGRYFEPIGLPLNDPIVVRAREEGRIEQAKWQDSWGDLEKRRVAGLHHDIASLGYLNMESTQLKRIMMQRMWRLKQHVREEACTTLESHDLTDEYLAYSVRRGDKDTEGFKFSKSEEYIEATESIVKQYFDNKIPKIFVATDDCAVMNEFRTLKPTWHFTSECDRNHEHNGFILADMRKWTLEQTDEHYRKFYVELMGMAGAKFYLGVTYTNVAWWEIYMRRHRWSHKFLDTPRRSNVFKTLNIW